MSEPHRVQRIGAYGIATWHETVLLSRLSPRGHPAGYWNLPGGRIEHGEDPRGALQREFREETSLEISQSALLDVISTHLIGPDRHGYQEDFHGLAIVFRVRVPHTRPHVRERDGTTDAVEWVPRDQLDERYRLTIVDHALHYVPFRG